MSSGTSELERSVLGGIMLTDGRALAEVMDVLKPVDFQLARNRTIYETILDLDMQNVPCDGVNVVEHLHRSVGDEEEWADYVSDIIERTASAANITSYAARLKEYAVRREMQQAAVKVHELSLDTRPLREVVSEAQRAVLDVGATSATEGPVPISKLVPGFIDALDVRHNDESKLMGISTGFKDLDRKISGYQKQSLIVIAGRPSMGKTALAMNSALHVALYQDLPVVIFSMEMSGQEIMSRVVSQMAKIPMHALMSGDMDGEEWTRTESALDRLGQMHHLDLDESPSMMLSQIKARTRRVKQRHGKLGLVIVDYLQLMQDESRSDNRAMQIADITRGLKAIAKELDVPVIILSQLNRDVDKREDKRPRMSDLRESGAIEQDADVIMFVYREAVYNEQTIDPKVAEIIVGKQRNGPTGTVLMYFFGEYTMFGQMEHDEQQQFWGRRHGTGKRSRYGRTASGDGEPF